MGLATLGGITFRLNPSEIQWSWKVHTNVEETLGGRVVQVYGASMSDIVINGLIGEDHMRSGGENASGRSWKMAEAFVKSIYNLMAKQAPPPGGKSGFTPGIPVRFTYFTQGDGKGLRGYHDYDFDVYVRSIVDQGGAAVIEHKTGKFSYGYTLTLVPIIDRTTKLVNDDWKNLKTSKDKAVEAALDRIANGLGWKETRFNDPTLAVNNADGLGNLTDTDVDYISDLRAAIKQQGGITGITPQVTDGDSGDGSHGTGDGNTDITAGAVQGNGADLVKQAQEYLGAPYVWGGDPYADTPPKTDCSGLVNRCFYDVTGQKMDPAKYRTTYKMGDLGDEVKSLKDAKPGDILLMMPGEGGDGPGHVAFYVSENKLIHDPSPGNVVSYSNIWQEPVGIRRLLDPNVGSGGDGSGGGNGDPGKKGDKVLDTAGTISAASAKKAGYIGLMTYNYCISKAIADDFKKNDMALGIVWEYQIDTILTGGKDGGRTAANNTVAATQAAGLPDGVIYFACDTDAISGGNDQGEGAKIKAFLEGAASVIGWENVGFYGGYYSCDWVLQNTKCKHIWQTMAWSAGKVLGGAALLQHPDQINIDGVGCDFNDVLGNWKPRI